MLKKTYSCVLFSSMLLVIFSCENRSTQKEDDSYITINLKSKTGNHKVFDSLYTDFHFNSRHLTNPKFYKYLIKSNKGLPILDTGIIANRYSDNLRFYFDLYQKGFMSDSLFEKRFKNRNLDSLGYHTNIDNELNAFIGLEKDKQIIVLDLNKNKDFSDDQILKFDKKFSANPYKDSTTFGKIPYLNYKYEFWDNGKIDNYNRKVVVYPASNHPYTQFFGKDSLNKNLHIMGKLKDYWKGEINFGDEKYTILCQGFRKEYLQFLIKPDSVDFHQNDYLKNKKFEYLMNDTITLADKLFVLDSFNLEKSQIKFRRLDDTITNFGFRVGEKLNDIFLEDLYGEKFQISNIKSGNKYILIDFWGTWCPPCIETTPKLKEMYRKHSENLEILGVAYDKSPEQVIKYSQKNNLGWKQAFSKRKYDPNSIVQKLRINYFPTFLLIDSDNNIVIRSIGMEGLLEIDAFLGNYK